MMSLSDYRRKFSGSFYLYGGVGTGKTHTAYSIRKMSIYIHILKGRSQIDVINFPEYVMQYKIGTFDAKQRIISDLSEEDYMILDDLGAEYVSDASLEMLMVILNARYEAGLYTGFTSNFSIGKLPYDARIKSRIAEIVGKRKHEMKGKDRRIKSEE